MHIVGCAPYGRNAMLPSGVNFRDATVDKYRERLHQGAQIDAGLAMKDNTNFFRFRRQISQNIIRGELNGQGKYHGV